MTAYRIQPAGLEIGAHRSLTSNETYDRGVHVFCTLGEVCCAVSGWVDESWQPEIVVIECQDRDVRDNGDYEGFVLLNNRGVITHRKSFPSWLALRTWCRACR